MLTDTERIALIVCGVVMAVYIVYVIAAIVGHKRNKRK